MTSGGNNFNNFFYCKTLIMMGQPFGWRGRQILFRGGRPGWPPPTGAGAAACPVIFLVSDGTKWQVFARIAVPEIVRLPLCWPELDVGHTFLPTQPTKLYIRSIVLFAA